MNKMSIEEIYAMYFENPQLAEKRMEVFTNDIIEYQGNKYYFVGLDGNMLLFMPINNYSLSPLIAYVYEFGFGDNVDYEKVETLMNLLFESHTKYIDPITSMESLHQYALDLMYPGSKEPMVATIFNGECMFNTEKMSCEKMVNEVAKRVGNEITSFSSCYKEGGFINERECGAFEDINCQEIDDYYINVDVLNYLTLIKAMSTASLKSEKIYFVSFDYESNITYYEIFETALQAKKYALENSIK